MRGIIVLAALLSLGCATTLNPELIEQRCRPDKPKGLDALPTMLDVGWVVLGIVPGIVAFGMDFGTRAIWVCERLVPLPQPEPADLFDAPIEWHDPHPHVVAPW